MKPSTETPDPISPSSEQAASPAAKPEAAAPAAASPPSEKHARPDWLGDQFWDADAGSIKGADLKAHLDDLTAFKAGEDSKRAAVPEKPDGYQLKLPADLDLGDGNKFEIDESDPMFGFGREVAHKLGLDQPGFEGLTGMYAQMRVAEAKELQAAQERHLEALGPKAKERQSAAKTFLAAKLGPDAPTLFEGVLMVQPGVEAVEKLIRIMSNGGTAGFSGGGREGGGKDKIEGWADMSPAEKMAAARRR